MYTQGSLFAGIGGICSAFSREGFELKFANEHDDRTASVYSRNYGSNVITDSIEKLTAQDLEPVDVLHGGFPCQSFSIAGKQGGFEDPRGKLFFEIIRIVNEFPKGKKPKVIVLENSKNLLEGNGGLWFRRVTHELAKAGYWYSAKNALVLNTALHSGIPQIRERLFIVALNADYFRSNSIVQSDFKEVPVRPLSDFIDFEGELDSCYYLKKDNKYYSIIISEKNSNPHQIYQLRKYYVRHAKEGVCPTLTANMGLGGHNVPFIINGDNIRKLSEFECLRLQGFDRDFIFPEEITRQWRYVMAGNAVSVPIASLIAKRVKKYLDEVMNEHKMEVSA